MSTKCNRSTPDLHDNSASPTLEDVLRLNEVVAPQDIRLFLLKPKSKVPYAKFHWPERATNDIRTLHVLHQQYPGSNVAGVIPGHIVVVDEDPKNSPYGQLLHERFIQQHGNLPNTWVSFSGKKNGGRHSYLFLPEGVTVPYNQKQLKLMDGAVELLGAGHYVVLPPSLHPDTRLSYAWDRQHNPFTMPLAAAPDWLVRHIQEATQSSRGESPRQDQPQTGKIFCSGWKGARKAPSRPVPVAHTTPPNTEERTIQESLLLQRLTAGEGTPRDLDSLTQIHAQEVVNALCRLWGRDPVRIGQTTLAFFRHEQHPSAAFMPARRGYGVLYKDHGDTRRGQTLVAMYVRIKCGAWMELTKTQYLTYGLDLLREAGVLTVPIKPLPKVDTPISSTRQKAQEGFERLLGDRALLKRQEGERADDTAFAQSFAAPWCGIEESEVNDAMIGMLLDGQVIHTRWREGITFFTRGTKKLVRVLADKVHEQEVTTLIKAIEINRDAQKTAEGIASPLRRTGQREPQEESAMPMLVDDDPWTHCLVCGTPFDENDFTFTCAHCGVQHPDPVPT